MRTQITRRTADRLQRLAFEMEHLAGRLLEAGHERTASTIRHSSALLGSAGRQLEEDIQAGRIRRWVD